MFWLISSCGEPLDGVKLRSARFVVLAPASLYPLAATRRTATFSLNVHRLLCGAAEHRFTARLHPRLFPAAFGRYRICKPVYTEHPRRDYLLTAEFTVIPFVPFTRFVR